MPNPAQEKSSASRTRTTLLNLGILLVSLCMAVLVAEYIARRIIGLPQFPPYYVGEFENRPSHNFAVDPHTGWRMAAQRSFRWKIGEGQDPVSYTANEDGFRADQGFSGDGSVVLIGDSFTFGTGVAFGDTFGALLENDLKNLPVYNLAMPGFGIDQMWMALKHQGPRYNPRLLVVAFVDKDLDRSLTAYREAEGMNKPAFVQEGGELRPRTAEDRPSDFVIAVQRQSALAGVVQENVKNLGYVLPLGGWWSLNAELFTRMMDDAKSQGVPLLFVRLPFRGERAFPTLDAFMESKGANYIDVESLSDQFDDADIFIPGDNHINEAGHRFAARAIRQWLLDNAPGFVRPEI